MEARRQHILAKVRKLRQLYRAGRLQTVSPHEVHPSLPKGDRTNYLYFTLPVAINFQRNSPAMWQSALQTWDDATTNYLFFPEEVVQKKFATIQNDLGKHRLALQINKHPKIWFTISTTLHAFFGDDPKAVLAAGDFDVRKIVDLIQVKRKADFPYLSGAKMVNYWLYMLYSFTDANLKNVQAISVIPDTHVVQCSVKLGLVPAGTDAQTVAQAWAALLQGSPLRPIDVHPVLWHWSRNGFLPAV